MKVISMDIFLQDHVQDFNLDGKLSLEKDLMF